MKFHWPLIYFSWNLSSAHSLVGGDHVWELLKLLVVDEMNCLQEFCGPALESVVTRITRQVGYSDALFLNYLHWRGNYAWYRWKTAKI